MEQFVDRGSVALHTGTGRKRIVRIRKCRKTNIIKKKNRLTLRLCLFLPRCLTETSTQKVESVITGISLSLSCPRRLRASFLNIRKQGYSPAKSSYGSHFSLKFTRSIHFLRCCL